MEKEKEKLSLSQLISEQNLAEALGVTKSTLYQLRSKGCPYVNLAKGKIYYSEPLFMDWLLKNRLRRGDSCQNEDEG